MQVTEGRTLDAKDLLSGLIRPFRSRRFEEMFVDLWKKRVRSLGSAGGSGTQTYKNLQVKREGLLMESAVFSGLGLMWCT